MPGSGFLRGVPGALGVVGGIWLYGQEPVYLKWVVPVVVLFAATMACLIARSIVTKVPRVALTLTECWVVATLAVAALFTHFVLYLTVSASFFNLQGDELTAIKGALVGALSTYFASAWVVEMNHSKGLLVPGGLYSRFLLHFSLHYELNVQCNERERAACVSETVPNSDIEGWGFRSRWNRARICAEYLNRKIESAQISRTTET